MTSNADFLDRLLEALPEARPHYEAIVTGARHGRDAGPDAPDAGSLPREDAALHVLADFSSSARDTFLAHGPGGAQLWRRMWEFLEAEYGRTPDQDILIESALLRLPGRYDPHQELRDDVGPKLIGALNRDLDFHADPVEDAFLTELRRRFPELETYVQDNTYGDHATLLAQPFLADVVRHVVGLHTSGDQRHHARAQEILGAIADHVGSDRRVEDLIATGFVENLPDPGRQGADIVRRLPPALVPIQESVRDDLTPLRRQAPPTRQ
ncbi:MAG: hypothetical protein ACFCVG_05370 [Kineosporiaceae bacterium]